MAALQITLLGGLAARLNGEPLSFPTRHCALLLAYLAMAPDERHARDKLAGLLWSERGEEQARGSLRQSLYRLRRLLDGLDPPPLHSDSQMAWLTGETLWCDVAAFEQAIHGEPEQLAEALELYRGELLANCGPSGPDFEAWLAEQRQRLRGLAAEGFYRLAAHQQEQRHYAEMERTAQRLVALDPLDEAARRLLMTALALQNKRNAALTAYKELHVILDKELGVAPQPETEALQARIRNDEEVAASPACAATSRAESKPAPPEPSGPPTIAVLPFENRLTEPDQQHLGDALSEEIIAGLSFLRWLRVIASPSSFAFRGSDASLQEISRALGARVLLSGRLEPGPQGLRVAARLIDAETATNIWSGRFDKALDDLFLLQEEIAGEIAGAIAPELEDFERERVRRRAPKSTDTWDLYQKGLWQLYRFTKESNEEAQRLFARVIAQDPGFPYAHTGRAYALHLAAIEGFGETTEAALKEAETAAREAIALDGKDAAALSILGRIHIMQRRHDLGLLEIERAVSLNGNLVQAQFGLGWANVFCGKPEAAIAPLDRAMALSPHDPNFWSFLVVKAWAFLLMQDFEAAKRCAQDASGRPHALFWAEASLAAAEAQLGDIQQACDTLRGVMVAQPGFSRAFVLRALPFREAAHAELLCEGLEKAGLVTA